MTGYPGSAQIVEALRKGLPPQRGVRSYSVGNEKLLDGIQKYHISGINERGIIRFINGSWGAGKTHFFRLLREVAFDHECLVSNVELNVTNAALNKFEKVFYAIVRNVSTPSHYRSSETSVVAVPFGLVVEESLRNLGKAGESIGHEDFVRANEALMSDHGIDIDFKKMIQEFWKTYLSESDDLAAIEARRQEILQWFSGEGTVGSYRKRFGVAKMVTKDNAKLMLQSLASFVRLSGYRGLVILFDEAEQAYSAMRRAALRDAHNNLLSLLNNIDSIPGLFLIYATTPDFFSDPKHGIVIYGALSGRIGRPEQRPPRAIDTIWNLDAVEEDLEHYKLAALRVRDIYAEAYPGVGPTMPGDDAIRNFVKELHAEHPSLSAIRFWRILVTAVVAQLDDCAEGDQRPVQRLYDDVIDRLREE